MRVHKTISLSPKQFQWARKQMVDNEWDRAGEDEGISRYVQELIKKDMKRPVEPVAAADAPKRIERLATRRRS